MHMCLTLFCSRGHIAELPSAFCTFIFLCFSLLYMLFLFLSHTHRHTDIHFFSVSVPLSFFLSLSHTLSFSLSLSLSLRRLLLRVVDGTEKNSGVRGYEYPGYEDMNIRGTRYEYPGYEGPWSTIFEPARPWGRGVVRSRCTLGFSPQQAVQQSAILLP